MGITIRSRSSTRRTMPVSFIFLSPIYVQITMLVFVKGRRLYRTKEKSPPLCREVAILILLVRSFVNLKRSGDNQHLQNPTCILPESRIMVVISAIKNYHSISSFRTHKVDSPLLFHASFPLCIVTAGDTSHDTLLLYYPHRTDGCPAKMFLHKENYPLGLLHRFKSKSNTKGIIYHYRMNIMRISST